MRIARFAICALAPFALLACSEEPAETEEAKEEPKAEGGFAQEAPPPPATGWSSDEGFASEDPALDPSFSEEQATSAEDVK